MRFPDAFFLFDTEAKSLLSYRHSFHAGNHADVLKHLIQVFALNYLTQKDKPFRYIETHAGAGAYALNTKHAQKTQEYLTGIDLLFKRESMPDIVADYVELVRIHNQQAGGAQSLAYYPGSPWLAQYLTRDQDKLMLHELHPADHQLLCSHLSGDKRVKVYQSDGFSGAVGLLPPPERRGLVMIDPSYELKSDYTQLVKYLREYYKRFAQGCYLIWYPVVERHYINTLENSIRDSGIRHVQQFELCITKDRQGHGMTGSGMLVINPPWTLQQEMQQTLPWLLSALGCRDGFYRIQQLVEQ